MNRIKNYNNLEAHIVHWMKSYLKKSGLSAWVIGVSGGVDSAVASTLAAKTGEKVYVVQMPIRQKKSEVDRAKMHIYWLIENFANVSEITCELTSVFDSFLSTVEKVDEKENQHMAEANTRSRMRMMTLYYYASIKKALVVGTGNKVEDYGAFFFTKGGDGMVDISPIGDLYKTEVRELGKHMRVLKELVEAKPTDGLWDDGRGDEDQLGASYENLEWAMEYLHDSNSRVGTTNPNEIYELENNLTYMFTIDELEDVEDEYGTEKANALEVLARLYDKGRHKILPIPVCEISTSNLKKAKL